MVAGMVTFKIAPGCLDRIIDRIRAFAGRTTNLAFVAVPSAPHRPGFAFFDVYRIPDTPFGVIVLMDFLNRHRTSFRLTLTFALNLGGDKFAVCSSTFEVPHSEFVAGRLGGCGLGVTRLLGQSRCASIREWDPPSPAAAGLRRDWLDATYGLVSRSEKPETERASTEPQTPNANP
jgi:hypothetical protein